MKIKFLFIFCFILVLTKSVLGCVCAPVSSIGFKLENSSTVFSGKVLSEQKRVGWKIYLDGNGKEEKYKELENIYKFQIYEVFKGKLKLKIVEVNAGPETDCGGRFTVGEDYLVWANGKALNQLYASTACSSSTILYSSKAHVYFLKKLVNGEKEPQIYGFINHPEYNENSENYLLSQTPNAKVILKGKNQTRLETFANSDGAYEFNDIPEGDYEIEAEFSDKLVSVNDFFESKFIVLENKKVMRNEPLGYFYAQNGFFHNIYLAWNNKVEGTVIDQDNNNLRIAKIELLPVNFPFKQMFSNIFADELKAGTYSVHSEPTGHYLLAYEVNSFQNGKRQRFYYPQTTNPKDAKVFKLSPIDKLNINIQVPLKTKEIKGEILWSDGSKINGSLNVFLTKEKSLKENSIKPLERANIKTNSSQFSLQGFENNEYWLHFYIQVKSNKPKTNNYEVKVKPIKVIVGKEDKTIKVLVPKPRNFKNL